MRGHQRTEWRLPRRRAAGIALTAAFGFVVASCQLLGVASPTPAASGPQDVPIASSTPSALGSPIPTSVAELGPIVDGVPATFDGAPVLRGDALRAAVAASTDARPFLAGGWFQATYSHLISYCSVVLPPRVIDTCDNNVLVYDEQVGWTRTQMTGGDTSIARDLLVLPDDHPVVLLVHTHDPACAQWRVKGFDCAHLPVASVVEWLGAAPPARPSPTPVGTPPATSISRAEAIALARSHTISGNGAALAVRCIAAAPYSLVWTNELPPPQPDEWVWSVVFTGGRWRSEKVSLDYVTGTRVADMGADWLQSCLGEVAPAA